MSLSIKLCAALIPALALLSGCAATEQVADRMPVAETPASENVASETPEKVVPPDQVDVAWEDNGTPIRPLSEPGRERHLESPVTAGHYRGKMSVAPPSNATSLEDAKKASASKKK